VTKQLSFTLVPALSSPLRIFGGAIVYLWLLAQTSVRGTLEVRISEITANASEIEIRSSSVTTALPSGPFSVIFGLGAANHTATAGSTLGLYVQFSPQKPVPVSLLWDDPSTPTRLVLKVLEIPRIDLTIRDTSGRVSTVFAEDAAGTAQMTVESFIEEPFGGTNIRLVSLSITNSTGYALIKDVPMNLTSRVEHPFRLGYSLPITVPSGEFNVTITVLDTVRRTFMTTKEIEVTHFYTIALLVVDTQQRPLPDLSISLSAERDFIDEVTTNSSGVAVCSLPSSRVVGPFSVSVRKDGVPILSTVVDVESDSMLQLEAPLSDWTFIVRAEILNLPVSGAKVDLYLDGTFVASSTTGTNGVALFTAIPPGAYEVDVVSSLASKRFFNVTHSAKFEQEQLELPVLSAIPTSMLPILAGVAILAVFVVFLVPLMKSRGRRFKHVAELLGGTIPTATLVLVVGPSGSGKTLLLQNVLADSLRLSRPCVYATNSELPSKIKDRLARMGVEAQKCQDKNVLRFVDAYSGGTGIVSLEKHYVSSPKDLTSLGIQITSSLEEVGGVGDVFLDSLGPIVGIGDPAQALGFVQYYGARIVKSGGTFIYVASDKIEASLLDRLEETSDCVLRTERFTAPGNIRGRLLVKKAVGLQHYEGWVGFKIRPSGRMEFLSLPGDNR